MLRVIYSTAEIDLVSEMLEKQQNILENYLPSKIVDSIGKYCVCCFIVCILEAK